MKSVLSLSKSVIFRLTCISFCFISWNVFAISCVKGCNSVSTNDLIQAFSSDENSIGRIVSSNRVSDNGGQRVRWGEKGSAQVWAYFIGSSIPGAGTPGKSPSYFKLDDYVSIAIRNHSIGCNTDQYVPFNDLIVDGDTCSPATFSSGMILSMDPSYYETQLRVDKKIVSGVYEKNVPVAVFGMCQPVGCASEQVLLTTLYLNVKITVPQSCSIDAGQTVSFDFGNIGQPAFVNAGAGNKPTGVRELTRNLSISCENIDVSSAMSLRLQADHVYGKALVSDNPDVGVIVADSNRTPLTPNDIDSKIKFRLDDNSVALVPITAWPVSITGNKPAEGKFTAEGYLRVDFD